MDEHDDVEAGESRSDIGRVPVEPISHVDVDEEHPLMHWARMIEDTIVNNLEEQPLLFSDYVDVRYGFTGTAPRRKL